MDRKTEKSCFYCRDKTVFSKVSRSALGPTQPLSNRYSRSCLVKVKVKFALEEATKAQRRRSGIRVFYSFFNLSARWWWVVNATPRLQFTPGKDPVPTVQEAGWASEPVWTGAEISPPTVIRSPDRPARSVFAIPLTLSLLLQALSPGIKRKTKHAD